MSLQIDFKLSYTGNGCLYREIYGRFRDAILNGSLPAGVRVPSIRALASELNISRNTVEKAYDLLIGDGLFTSNGAAGTTVTSHLPRRSTNAKHLKLEQSATPCQSSVNLSTLDRSLGSKDATRDSRNDEVEPFSNPAQRPFQLGIPALDAFPLGAWLVLNRRILRDRRSIRDEAEPQGYFPLRQAVAAYVQISRGVKCSASQVFITQGYRQSLALLVMALLRPGDVVWVEDPGYPLALRILPRLGVELAPIPVDACGIDVCAGRKLAPHARMALVTPANQSPLGTVMSLVRRNELASWAGENDAWILEDDYDSEFCQEGRLQPTLSSMDRIGTTILLGTFSKTLHPALRTSYFVAPPQLVQVLRDLCFDMVDGAPVPIQRALAAFMTEGHYSRHLKRMRILYARRRQILIDSLASRLGGALRAPPSGAGLRVLAQLADGIRDTDVLAKAERKGLAIGVLSTRCVVTASRTGLLLGHSNFQDASAASSAVDDLATCF